MENTVNNNEAPVTDTPEATAQERNEPQVDLVPKKIKSLKLKIDGQEFDEELPFEISDDPKAIEYLKRNLQLSKVANKRMSESAMTRKQAEQFIEALQTDPMRILGNAKIMGEEKFQKLAEEFLSKKIQQQMLSPQERDQLEKEERLRRYEEQERQRNEQEEQARMQELQKHYQESYTKTITQALDASNLPKNPFTVKRMAQLLQQNISYGLEIEPAQLAQLVREDYQKELAAIIGNSSPEQILGMFGDDVTNKLRKHDLEKLKGSLTPNAVRTAPKHENRTEEPPRKRSWSEFNEEIKKKL